MKPGVFTQLYVHIVFAVKYRERVLNDEIRDELFKYSSGIITNRKHKSIVINGTFDHIHLLVGLNPNEKISDLLGCVKRESSAFINNKKYFPGKFRWQDGYGAFSYGRSQLDNIYKYIAKQAVHHKKKTFREEYIDLLKKFDIKFDEKYLFDFFD